MVIKSQPERLYSLDALRGFDMFWIMGGEYIFKGLATLTGWPLLLWWAEQLDHVEWHGFRFYDMIFPLFLFIAGISFPYSLASRTARQESRASLYRHVISRGFILVLLGILYNNAVSFDLAHLRYGSVLGRIGLAWMFAALIAMNTGIRTRIAWFWGLLVGYWLLLYFFPIHHFGAADIFSRQGNLASYLDRLLLPGRLHIGDHDPEGILSTMPAISTALLGMFAGEFLRSTWRNLSLRQKGLAMILAGSGLAAIGQIWNLFFPINKNLWSSSFVCYAGGLSLILFSVFYLIIDVWNCRRWSFFFVVIGVNPITIYLTERIVQFKSTANFFFGWTLSLFPEAWTPFLNALAMTAVGWVLLYLLFKKKIFLKV